MNKEDLVERAARAGWEAIEVVTWEHASDSQRAMARNFTRAALATCDELARLRRELEEARKALEPFADAVFNDNGDMTVNRSFPTYDDFVRAYFAQKKARAALRAGEAGK